MTNPARNGVKTQTSKAVDPRRRRLEIRRLIRDYETPPNPVNLKDRHHIALEICRAILRYIEFEQTHLYPSIDRDCVEGVSLDYQIAESQILASLAHRIRSMDGDQDRFRGMVEVLCEYITRHFRDQEETLSPCLGRARAKQTATAPDSAAA